MKKNRITFKSSLYLFLEVVHIFEVLEFTIV